MGTRSFSHWQVARKDHRTNIQPLEMVSELQTKVSGLFLHRSRTCEPAHSRVAQEVYKGEEEIVLCGFSHNTIFGRLRMNNKPACEVNRSTMQKYSWIRASKISIVMVRSISTHSLLFAQLRMYNRHDLYPF